MRPRADYAERIKMVEAFVVKEGLFHQSATQVINAVWAMLDKEGKTRLADFKIREIRHKVRANAGLPRDGLPTYPKHRKPTDAHAEALAWGKKYLQESGGLVWHMECQDLKDEASKAGFTLGLAAASRLLKNVRARKGREMSPRANGKLVVKPAKAAGIQEDVLVLAHAMKQYGFSSIGVSVTDGKVTWTGDRKKVEVVAVHGEMRLQ